MKKQQIKIKFEVSMYEGFLGCRMSFPVSQSLSVPAFKFPLVYRVETTA